MALYTFVFFYQFKNVLWVERKKMALKEYVICLRNQLVFDIPLLGQMESKCLISKQKKTV